MHFVAFFDSVDSLGVELVVNEINNSPDTRDAYYRVENTCADVCFGREYPIDEVEIENTHAQPVECAYYEQYQAITVIMTASFYID